MRSRRRSAGRERRSRQGCPGPASARRHVPHADALAEARRHRSAGHAADGASFGVEDLAAGTRDRPLEHAERDEPVRRPVLARARQHVRAGELTLARADPAEAGLDRVRVRPDVVPVQRVTDLEPQRVARAEAAGQRAGLGQRIPQALGIGGGRDQLDAELARVAGARDGAVDTRDVEGSPGERRRRARSRTIRPPDARAARATSGPCSASMAVSSLTSDSSLLGGRASRCARSSSRFAAFTTSEEALAPPVDDEVVDDAAGLVREQRVLRLSRCEHVEIVREQLLQARLRARLRGPRSDPCGRRRRRLRRCAPRGAPR